MSQQRVTVIIGTRALLRTATRAYRVLAKTSVMPMVTDMSPPRKVGGA